MIALLHISIWLLAIVVAIPAIILFLETTASFLPYGRTLKGKTPGSLALVVPAHNESVHLIDTLKDLSAARRANDKIIVVADNCTDDTASIAEQQGATVLLRNEPDRAGKGYALQFALDFLRAAPPAAVLFFDADCRVSPDGVTQLAAAAIGENRPIQALYLMKAAPGASPIRHVAAFAWLFINKVRMKGLFTIANATRFTGAGLALPWELAAKLDFGTDNITEDLVMSLTMAEMGAAPALAPEVLVTSSFPETEAAAVTQRARWEHGALKVLAHRTAPALLKGVRSGNGALAMLALDAMAPPVVMLGALLFSTLGITGMAAGFVGSAPFWIVAISACLYLFSLSVAWIVYGRDVLPPSKLIAAVPFLLQKFKIYGNRGRESSKQWTRTARGGPDHEPK